MQDPDPHHPALFATISLLILYQRLCTRVFTDSRLISYHIISSHIYVPCSKHLRFSDRSGGYVFCFGNQPPAARFFHLLQSVRVLSDSQDFDWAGGIVYIYPGNSARTYLLRRASTNCQRRETATSPGAEGHALLARPSSHSLISTSTRGGLPPCLLPTYHEENLQPLWCRVKATTSLGTLHRIPFCLSDSTALDVNLSIALILTYVLP